MNLEEISLLNEAYQDRVQTVANAVIKRSASSPFTKEELLRAIEREAEYANVAEVKFKDTPRSTAWKDFVKDVINSTKGKLKWSRPGVAVSAAARKKSKEELENKIVNIIEDAVAQSFPDGDPTDIIWPRVERLGFNPWEIGSVIDGVCHNRFGVKDFNEYQGNMYDDCLADNPYALIDSGYIRNPFNNKPFNYTGAVEILIKTDPDAIIEVLSEEEVIKNSPGIIDIISNNKEIILTSLLKTIRARRLDLTIKVVRNLITAGVDWPEFKIIQKSIDPSALAEKIKVGDVLTIEGLTESVVGTVLSIENGTIIIEGDVISNKLSLKQAQKGKDQYKFNPDVADIIPRYNPKTRRKVSPSYFSGEEEPFEYFEVRPINNKSAHIVGITRAGDEIITSTTRIDVATALVNAFNRGGFSNKDIQKVRLGLDSLSEAEYQGKKVQLGKPMRDTGGSKKFKVYVKNPKTGNIKKVSFGDKNMEIKRDNPERRKSFRARHGCGTSRASDRTKAAYWSCRMWSSKPVGKITKE